MSYQLGTVAFSSLKQKIHILPEGTVERTFTQQCKENPWLYRHRSVWVLFGYNQSLIRIRF